MEETKIVQVHVAATYLVEMPKKASYKSAWKVVERNILKKLPAKSIRAAEVQAMEVYGSDHEPVMSESDIEETFYGDQEAFDA